MKVKIHAFEWKTSNPTVTIDSFCKTLIASSGSEKLKEILWYVTPCTGQENVLVGAFLTIRDTNILMTLKKKKGHIVVSPEQLEAGTSLIDFNFFLLDMKTHFGLYQYYYKSASLHNFCFKMKEIYNSLRLFMLNNRLREAKPKTKYEEKSIIRAYRGPLRYAIVERAGAFAERIRSLHDVKSIKYEYTTIDAAEGAYTPLKEKASRISHQVVFKKTLTASDRISAAARFASEHPLLRGAVTGVDIHNDDVTYKMLHDYDRFAELEYDEIAPSLAIDASDVEKSINANMLVAKLIQVARDHSKYFPSIR